MNSLDKNINYTIEEGQSLQFLSFKLSKVNNILNIAINYKITNSHAYLSFHSHHPRHVKTSLPTNMFKRIMKIDENQNTLIKDLSNMYLFLQDRKYHPSLLDHALKMSLNNNYVSTNKNPRDTNIIQCILLYNEKNPDIKPHINSIYNLLRQDERLKHIFQPHNLQFTYRQPPNLSVRSTTHKNVHI